MIFYDFEVFEKDWLSVFIDVTKKKEHVIINSPDKLKALYEANRKDIWVGFNNRHYDQYIMKGILLGMNPKKINDWIIVDNKEGWQYSRAFNKLPMINYDVMPSNDETMKTVGLKTMEGFLGSNIKETDVDFRIKRKLTQEEIEQTVKYCRHDVEQTIKVFLEKVSEFNAVHGIIQAFPKETSLYDIGDSEARITAKVLGCSKTHFGDEFDDETIEKLVQDRLKDELKSGVQTIQYQINTLMTTNGQSPFVTLFLNLDEKNEYIEENAMIVEEILRQRLEGIKNEKGVYVTPAFPKLIYVLDENNCLKGGKYDYITKLAVKCSAKRMYPDYISAKKMRENYEGNVFSCMGCRSFLSPWKDENGNYKFEGRFNQGVVSINLPQIGILAKGNEEVFWKLMDERLELCFEALMCRHNALKGTLSDVSPIHWQYGAIARLDKGEKIDPLLYGGYSTMSLGYIGLYEVTKLMKGVSHTDPVGEEFALRVMNHMKEAADRWRDETNIGFSLYGTPAESLCYRFARIDLEKFGEIKNITDKGYYTNSYHVDVREKIDAFSKFSFESQFQKISSGGSISYVEIPNMRHNLEALEEVVKFIYDNIQYAEFNTKSDYCHVCGYDGEIKINDDLEWECPQCGNKDHSKMNVTRRTCGYLGENFWNVGKTKEINARVMHL